MYERSGRILLHVRTIKLRITRTLSSLTDGARINYDNIDIFLYSVIYIYSDLIYAMHKGRSLVNIFNTYIIAVIKTKYLHKL